MKGRNLLKELFIIQDTKEQLRIINEYDFNINGFKNIDVKTLEKFSPKIANDIINNDNYNKIISKNYENIHKFNFKMDVYLDISNIIEKHGANWDHLIQILLSNHFGELSEKLIKELKNNRDIKVKENLNRNMIVENEQENKIKSFRNIIIELEKKNSSLIEKNQKIGNENTSLKQEVLYEKNKSKKWKEASEKISIEYQQFQKHANDMKAELYNTNHQNEELLKLLETAKIRNTKLEEAVSKFTIHLLGFDENIISDSEYKVIFYLLEEVDKFIELSNIKRNDYFYAYKFGVPTSALLKISAYKKINIIDDLRNIKGGFLNER